MRMLGWVPYSILRLNHDISRSRRAREVCCDMWTLLIKVHWLLPPFHFDIWLTSQTASHLRLRVLFNLNCIRSSEMCWHEFTDIFIYLICIYLYLYYVRIMLMVFIVIEWLINWWLIISAKLPVCLNNNYLNVWSILYRHSEYWI